MTEFSLTPHISEIPITVENTRLFRTRSIAAGLVAAGLLIGGATTAEANTPDHTYSVVNTDGEGAWLHADPGLEDEGDLIKIMPEGTAFDADCYVLDTPIGPNGNEIWLHGTDDTGATGYFTDHYSDSEWSNRTGNTLHSQGLPFCDEEAQSGDAWPVQDMYYDRDAAVAWARNHAQATPLYNASCTNFVSNALWAGGLPETDEWTDDGPMYGDDPFNQRPGISTAWAAQHLFEYLKDEFPGTKIVELDSQRFRDNAIPEAQLGDLITYDWQNDGELDHMAIVTDITSGAYPEVSDWSVAGGTNPASYVDRGWTYSGTNKRWLQDSSQYVTAKLIKIDPIRESEF